MINIDKIFGGLIGLEKIKNKLGFHLSNYEVSQTLPNILLSSARGLGKTTLLRRISRSIPISDNPNRLRLAVEVSGSVLDSVPTLFDAFLIPQVINNNITVFIDEAHEMDKKVMVAFLTILNIDPNNLITSYNYNGVDYQFNSRKISWLFGTTNKEKIIEPFISRCLELDIPLYTNEQMAEIFTGHLKNIKIDKKLANEIAPILKKTPRESVKLADGISTFLKRNGQSVLTPEIWRNLVGQLSIRELGISDLEYDYLKILRKYPAGSSLSKISSILCLEPETIRRTLEFSLMRNQLIEIVAARGRRLTADGYKYLDRNK